MLYVLSSAVSVTYLTFTCRESAYAAFDRHAAKGYEGLCLSYGDKILMLQ
jgi:hypothetical protein